MSKPAPRPSEQEIRAQFQIKSNEIRALVDKIGELEREAEEHGLVIETLREAFAANPDRKCFRMVGGVLVERTVKDVLPALESNHQQIKGVMERLLEEYKKKEGDFSKFQRDNNIKVQQR